MKKIKQKLALRSSGREAKVNEECDIHGNSAGLHGSTYSGSTLVGGQAKEERRPWGLKELCPGRDPIVE